MKEVIETLKAILWCLNEIRDALKNANPNSDLMTLKEVARDLRMSEKTVKRRVENGDLPSRRIWGNKNVKWMFSKKEIEEFKGDCF